MCLDFVADHIFAVESFHRFPSLVAEVIFKKCIELNKFKAINNLKLFTTEYPQLICPSLDLSQRDIYNYKQLFNIISSCHIVELNLDSSDIASSGLSLFEVLKPSSKFLKILSLRSNNLNDDYVKKSTLPVRLGVVRFDQLRFVDLGDNRRLTSACLANFDRFHSLNEIVVDFKNPIGKMNVCLCSEKSKVSSIATKGWLSLLNLDDFENSGKDFGVDEMNSFYKKENTEPEIAAKKVEVNNYNGETAIHLKRECKCFDQIKILEEKQKIKQKKGVNKVNNGFTGVKIDSNEIQYLLGIYQ